MFRGQLKKRFDISLESQGGSEQNVVLVTESTSYRVPCWEYSAPRTVIDGRRPIRETVRQKLESQVGSGQHVVFVTESTKAEDIRR